MSDLYDIAASGMAAQRMQMDLIAENLANAGAVRADGSIFRPKTAVVQSVGSAELAPFQDAMDGAAGQTPLSSSFAIGDPSESSDAAFSIDASGFSIAGEADQTPAPAGVIVAGIVDQQRLPQYRLDPGNPFAQKGGPHKGYVAMPDVDPIEQMIALVSSGRAYDADVSMLQAAKQMDLEAADIDRA